MNGRIDATQVAPAYTSTQCSKCGTTLDENHTTQTRFCCQNCGYEVNVDYKVVTRLYLGQPERKRSVDVHKSFTLVSRPEASGFWWR
ncbi:transposase [Halocatena salina]|uniref:Transposase n=1 Tax=Halocatena salina TaxID=2934340 RepID=A0A8U0A691_9EURY|nr:transposase [Halocatena salina]UPM44396.1 transposase [Halocatena salina]